MTTKRVRVTIYRDLEIQERAHIEVDVPAGASPDEVADLAWLAYDEHNDKWSSPEIEWEEIGCHDKERREDLTARDPDFNIVNVTPTEAAA